MKQLFIVGPRKSEVRDVPDLRPGKGEILLKVKYNGVCMSDWHPWDLAQGGGVPLGHEPLGTVAEVGEGATGWSVGDRATGLCKTPALAEYCLMDADLTVHIPENLRDEDAVAEPLSCLVSAASKLHVKVAGDTAVVVGLGYMGLGIMTLLKMQGAGKIIAVDPRKQALENAERFGATECYTPDSLPRNYYLLDMDEPIWERGFQLVSEFSGTESGLRLAGDMTGVNGTMGAGGWHQGGDRSVDFRQWGWKGMTIINTHERLSHFQAACCDRALEMLSNGSWAFTGVSDHIYGLNEFDLANAELEAKPVEKNIIKSLIDCRSF